MKPLDVLGAGVLAVVLAFTFVACQPPPAATPHVENNFQKVAGRAIGVTATFYNPKTGTCVLAYSEGGLLRLGPEDCQ